MKLNYPIIANLQGTSFDFMSQGNNGPIPKRISFKTTEYDEIYNLVFGELGLTGELDDTLNTHNNDTEIIIATIISAIYAFTASHPSAWVFASGKTAILVRFYKIMIQKYLEEIKDDFNVYEDIEIYWEKYGVKIPCDGFVVRRK